MRKIIKFYIPQISPTSSFIEGMGSVIDITGCHNDSYITPMNDADALRQDWDIIGHDFTIAFDNLKQEVKKHG